jgi:hypothetical protein
MKEMRVRASGSAATKTGETGVGVGSEEGLTAMGGLSAVEGDPLTLAPGSVGAGSANRRSGLGDPADQASAAWRNAQATARRPWKG